MIRNRLDHLRRIEGHRFSFDLLLEHRNCCEQIACRRDGHTPDPPVRRKTNFEAGSSTYFAIEYSTICSFVPYQSEVRVVAAFR